MVILVNGKEALIKSGTSFDYIADNRDFSNSDGYSLSISFPLRNCPQNVDIFGILNRRDAIFDNIHFDCEIRDKDFHYNGVLAIVDVNETEVKAQFLQGRSAQNFDFSLDEVYINELNLGICPFTVANDPELYWDVNVIYRQFGCVSLPWVNNESGNIQNNVVFNTVTHKYEWRTNGIARLSGFPYLTFITKKICEQIGYDCDISKWEANPLLKYMIICNALPAAWEVPDFARALPHWSVTEYFHKLELFLGCEFEIDSKSKSVSLSFTKETLTALPQISLDKIVDSYEASVSKEDDSKYIESANVRYKEQSHIMQNIYSCDWFIDEAKNGAVVYDTFAELYKANEQIIKFPWFVNYGDGNIQKTLYAKDVDTYFVFRAVESKYNTDTKTTSKRVLLQPVNMFGDFIANENGENDIQLDFVPACIDDVGETEGFAVYLDMASFDEAGQSEPGAGEQDPNEIKQPFSMQKLEVGEQKDLTAYFDQIFIAYWDGVIHDYTRLPHPIIDRVNLQSGGYFLSDFSLRLKTPLGKAGGQLYRIDGKKKYQFRFLYNGMPNVRSVFLIGGQKYLCAKITTTISEDGMSELKKGEFYRIV